MMRRISNTTGKLIAIVASGVIGACGGDGDGGTEPNPTIDITLSATTLSMMQGQNGTVNVTLARGGGFSGAVSIAVEGAPAGVSATPEPSSIPAGSTSSTITVAAAASTTPGNYTLTVRATGQGVTAKTASIAFTVTAAPAQGFTIAVAPTTLPVQQSANGTATITVTRTGGFAGAVNLTATGLPAGVTAAFNPTSVTTNTSTLTLSATATAAVGQATVTIRGAAPPLTEQTATLTLDVTAAPGGPGNTTWEFCSASDMPLWLAFQDGTGAWMRVTPTGTRFEFNISSTNGGVAYVTATSDDDVTTAARTAVLPVAMRTARELRRSVKEAKSNRYASPFAVLVDGFDLTVIYGTQTELNAQGTSQCLSGPGKTVNGTVANLTGGQTASINLGDAVAEVAPGESAFQLLGVPDGALDLIATRGSFNPDDFSFPIDRIIIRRGLDQPNNSTLAVLDFSAAESFAPAQANLTVANLGNDVPIVVTSYFTASGTGGASLFTGIGTGTGPFLYHGVPAARQITGDLHLALVLAAPQQDASSARLAGLFFTEPTDRTVTLGAALPNQTIAVASTTPYVRLRAQGSVTAAYNKFIQVMWEQTNPTVLRLASIGASSAYLANATSYDFTIPDFSATGGWDNNWAPRSGVETEWSVTALGFTGIGLTSPRPVDGSTVQGAIRIGTITP